MASRPASTARPMATSASSSVCPGDPVGLEGADARPEGHGGPDRGAHRPHDLDQELGPPLGRTSPAVVALVAARAEERVQQVAVAGVQLDAVEAAARTRRAASTKRSTTQARSSSVATSTRYAAVGYAEGRHQVGRLLRRDHAGELVRGGRPLLRRHEQRPARGDVEQALGAVVHELGGDGAAVAVGVVGQAPQPREVVVVGGAELPGVGAGDRMGHADRPHDHQAGATPCSGLVPGRLGVADGAVRLTQVGAHRAQGDPVAEPQRPQVDGRQQPLEPAHPIVVRRAHHSWSV